jgi:hypothetical protein
VYKVSGRKKINNLESLYTSKKHNPVGLSLITIEQNVAARSNAKNNSWHFAKVPSETGSSAACGCTQPGITSHRPRKIQISNVGD